MSPEVHGLPPSPFEPPKHLLPLFAYARLRDATFVARLLQHPVEPVTALLDGHELVTVPGFVSPLLVETDGAEVEGTLYRDLTAEDFRRLDAYEGLSEGLNLRVEQTVRTDGGSIERAFAYLMTHKAVPRERG